MAGRPKHKADTAMLANIVPSFAKEIYARIEAGEATWKVAEFAGVSKSALTDWLEDPARIDSYKRARARAAGHLAEQTISIADGQGAATEAHGEGSAESGDVARDKLRIQARQWLASRWDRDTYGERAQQSVTINMATLHIDALRRSSSAPPAQQLAIEAAAEPSE